MPSQERTLSSSSAPVGRSFFQFGFWTFLSRIAGFVREMLAAGVLGAGGAYDAFIIAFKIPNFFRRLFAEGAFSQALVPILSQYYSKAQTPQEGQRFLGLIIGDLCILLALFTVVGILAAPFLIRVFAPGFAENSAFYGMAVELLRITFSYLWCISVVALLSAVTNIHGHFIAGAAAPILLNLSMMGALACMYWGACLADIRFLAWSVLAGGLVQVLLLLAVARALGIRWVWGWSLRDPRIQRLFELWGGALFAASVFQINMMITSIFASYLPLGSISWLHFSERVLEFPLGVFGAALVTVLVPRLSRSYLDQRREEVNRLLQVSGRWILFLGVPASIGLAFLSEHIICTLFQYGMFTREDTVMTAASLCVFSAGICPFIANKLYTSVYYTRQEIAFPLKIAMGTVFLNAALNALCMPWGAHAGLALASILTAWINFTCLYWGLRRRHCVLMGAQNRAWLWKVAIAGLGMGLLLYLITPSVDFWQEGSMLWRFAILLFYMSMGLLCYLFLLFLLGARPALLRLSA